MKPVLPLAALLLLAACGGPSESPPHESHAADVELQGDDAAWRKVDELRAAHPDLRVLEVARIPGAGLHHVRVYWPDAPHEVVVLRDGRLTGVASAREAFAEAYRRVWGAIALETAALMVELPPDEPHRFAIFVTDDRQGTAAMEAAARLDPDAERRDTTLRFVEAELLPSAVRRSFARHPGVLRIVSSGTGIATTHEVE